MNPVSKILIAAGVVLILAGLFWQFGAKLGLGRLPGDIAIERGNMRVYFPLMTSLLLSAGLSLVLYLVRLFRG